jgi:hypothetical protein
MKDLFAAASNKSIALEAYPRQPLSSQAYLSRAAAKPIFLARL